MKLAGWNGIAAISCRNLATNQNLAGALCVIFSNQFAWSARSNISSRASIRYATIGFDAKIESSVVYQFEIGNF
jgi:hypothetical protein